MKHFDLDWTEVFRALAGWDAVSVDARRNLLDVLKPSATVPLKVLSRDLDELVASGLVSASPTRAGVAEEHRGFVRALRAMDRQCGLFEDPEPRAVAGYLAEHLTNEETAALDPDNRNRFSYGGVNRGVIADLVTSAEWIEEFLACETSGAAAEWERARGDGSGPPRFKAREVHDAARRLVRALVPHPEGVPLRELPALVPGVGVAPLAAALHAALRYLLAYASLGETDLEPRVGLWPPLARRLLLPEPAAPQPVEAAERFHAAFLMEDMTAVLVDASAEPIRLRANDGAIFARAKQAIEARLVGLPAWAEQMLRQDADTRIEQAAHVLRALGFAADRGEAGQSLHLAPTAKGSRWLVLPDRDRLAALLEPLRKEKEKNPARWHRVAAEWGFFPFRLDLATAKDGLDLRASLAGAFLGLQDDVFFPVTGFLEYHRRTRNPFLAARETGARAHRTAYGRRMRREDWETLWGDLLFNFLVARLAALGGVRLGRTADGHACFAITRIGRYLLGAADEFEYGYEAEAEVIVQPNFEIVFLAAAPKLEAQLARFAERVGAGPGVMFRITKASVLAAAEAGAEAAQVVDALRDASTRELPGNVERQIGDWFSGVRRISMRPTILLRCPDAETAARVRAAGRADVRPVTDTVLEMRVSTTKARTALVRQLRKAGIFVDG